MKKQNLYSALGIIIVVVAVIALNYGLSLGRQRIDLTAGKLYTLSEGTRKTLQSLKEPVKIRLYYTAGDETIPIQIRTFARRVDDLLKEYRQIGGDKVLIERLNPQPDSEVEDMATLDGVEAQATPNGDRFYLGLAVVQGEQRSAIPALSADRERLLEYDLTRAITRTTVKEKPVLGLMSPLQLAGNPMAMMMGQGAPQPQIVYSELQKDYDVKQVELSADKIDDDIKTLLVIHPRGISDQAQYAIDQFVLRGGRLIAFVDPFAYLDQIPGMPPQMQGGTSSNLGTLFKAWGIEMEKGKIVLDLENAAGAGNRRMPTVLALDGPALNQTDIATSQAGNALIPMAGAFTGKPVEGLSQTVLLKSSRNAQLVDTTGADKRGEEALRGFAASGTEYPIAIKLSGRFKTAFPEGRPVKEEKEDKKDEKEDKNDDKADKSAAARDPKTDKPKQDKAPDEAAKGNGGEAKPKFAADPAQVKESKDENTVVLFADSDFLQDGAAVQIQEIFGRRIAIPVNGNLPLFQAVVEQMAGDPALIKLGSRAITARPLTVVKYMEAQAEQAYLGKLKELEDNLQQTKEKLAALEKSRPGEKGPGGGQAAAAAKAELTPEQQQEVESFRKKVLETRRELKEVRKELRADVEALQFWTKVINIAFLPALIVLVGIGIGVWKRRRVARTVNRPSGNPA